MVDALFKLEKITCCNCGIPFWIDSDYDKDLHRTKTSFFCPKGHCQSYTGESDESKCKRYKKLMDESNARNLGLHEQNHMLTKSITGYKGLIGKLKKKAKQ